MVSRASLAEESDTQLLRRFADGRDECAFSCLVSRHTRLVLGVCHRMMRNRQDAEDAFQAVMLTMATKSRSLKNVRSLSAWLYGVSVRTSLNLRRMNRKWERALADAQPVEIAVTHAGGRSELVDWLDEELAKLPDRYRDVMVLCDLEGHSQQEVARRLKIPLGTVASRLARGRKLLRDGLERRGVTIAVGGPVGVLLPAAQSTPTASPALVEDTVRRAMMIVAGKPLTLAASERVSTLVHEVMRTMMIAKLKMVSCLCALALVIVVATPALMSMLGLSANTTHAATVYFHDDFEDDSATDGSPVTWADGPAWPFSSFSVADGNLRLEPRSPGISSVIGVPEWRLGDASIRAQVRLEGETDNAVVGVSVRTDLNTGYAYHIDVTADGVVGIGILGAYEDIQTDLRPKDEDIVLQLDVIGDMINGWAWRAGEEMPAAPLATRVDDRLSSGVPGVYYTNFHLPEGDSGTGIVRYVRVAEPIPEPSAAALFGIALLTMRGISRWPRLSRP